MIAVSEPIYRSRAAEREELLLASGGSGVITLFCFAGRRENMEIQLPYIRRILEDHPNTEYHIWNMARTVEDCRYLKKLTGERITVIDWLYGTADFDRVYKHYAHPAFQDHLFVKIDDDVVFIESHRFRDFITVVDSNRDSIISAKVVNNGACTLTEPGLIDGFRSLAPLRLLDVHFSREYLEMSHGYMFDHWPELLCQPIELVPTTDWLSINLVGYDWQMGCRIAARLGEPGGHCIAGRLFPDAPLGDEGRVNMLPRSILQGFLACHLSFGPQGDDLDEIRKHYAALGVEYLQSC